MFLLSAQYWEIPIIRGAGYDIFAFVAIYNGLSVSYMLFVYVVHVVAMSEQVKQYCSLDYESVLCSGEEK